MKSEPVPRFNESKELVTAPVTVASPVPAAGVTVTVAPRTLIRHSCLPSLRRCLLYWLRFLFLLLFVLLFDWSFLVQNNSGKIEMLLQECLS